MKDRISLNPGRVLITPEFGGEPYYATLARADNPTQDGDPLNKMTFLKDYTCGLLGIPDSAVPDDALLALFIGVGNYGYRVKVQLADGTPVSGATVSGISAISGSTLVTNEEGIVLGKSTSSSVTIGCTSPYIDLKAPEKQEITSTGTITDVVLTLSNNTDIILITASSTKKILKATKYDATAVGGGGGGGYKSGSSPNTGGGGGGGYAVSSLNNDVPPDKTLVISIGAGGAYGMPGSSGGSTKVSLSSGSDVVSAPGGSGGTFMNGETAGVGGSGNGAGGNGSGTTGTSKSGSAGSSYIFNDSSLGKAGGGGGGGGSFGSATVAPGGSPNGGKGAYATSSGTSAAENGSEPGGGGGGGAGYSVSVTSKGGKGGKGGVYIRFRFA